MQRRLAGGVLLVAPAFALCMLLSPWSAAFFWPADNGIELAQKSGWEDVGELGDGWDDVGILDEKPNPPPFFSANPNMLAAGEGGAWEWPYVEYGQDLKGSNSGYDWEGATTRVMARGLDMPHSHDLWGELPPYHDWDTLGRRASHNAYHGIQEHDEVVPASSLPGFKQHQKAAAVKAHKGQHGLVKQSLANSYTDYGMTGEALQCTCDSAHAGDEEMEGINPNVKPACTCKGGRRTVTTNTEEGGPLDTGANGAWPQGLPSDGVSYIDGGSVQAFKTFPQSLAFYPNPRTAAALAGTRPGSPERGAAAFKYLTRLAEETIGEEQEEQEEGAEEQERAHGEEEHEGAEEAEGAEEPAAAAQEEGSAGEAGEEQEQEQGEEGEREEEAPHEEGAEAAAAEEEEEEQEEEEEEMEPTVDELLDGAQGELAVLDRLLLLRMKTSLSLFLEEAGTCEEQKQCKDSLCACKRRVGRHLCYKLAVAWPECDKSPKKVCELPAMEDAHRMCKVVEKLPGVNIDSIPVMDDVMPGVIKSDPTFFVAPEGVYQ